MSVCCVSGCKNRHTFSCKLRFYRIPSQSHPLHADRRKLWLEALRAVSVNTEELRGDARVCGAHFISGEASMDHDSPDFVPSVFTCAKQNVSAKKGKWYYGSRKKRRRTTNTTAGNRLTPARVDSPVDLQSLVLMEEISTPSLPQEEETKEEIDTETALIESPSPTDASPSFKAPVGIQVLDSRLPVVHLKHVFTAAGGYQCVLCDQNFTDASLLVKHIPTHEEEQTSSMCETCARFFTSQTDFDQHLCFQETLFPCNMCDRTFTTSQNLKRHKLLHVKDSRKCRKCGVLFCRQHDHVAVLIKVEPEQDIAIASEPEDGDSDSDSDSDVMPESNVLEDPEPIQAARVEDVKSDVVMTPVPVTSESSVPSLPIKPEPSPKQIQHRIHLPQPRIYSGLTIPVLLRPSSSSVPQYSKEPGPSCKTEPQSTDISEGFNPPKHSDLPPSLKMFSPKFLTSAFLQVTRNYDYLLSKPADRERKMDLKMAQTLKRPRITPDERSVKRPKTERTAYDLEFVV